MHLAWRMYHVHLKIILFHCQVECSINVIQVKLLNVVIQIIFFIFTDFLSSCFINH